MPVPLIKRGANQAGYPGKKLPAGPPSQGAVSVPDKPCRMIPFRRTPEEVGVGGREVCWCQPFSLGLSVINKKPEKVKMSFPGAADV